MAERKSDQAVEAFSAPRTLLREAQMEARRRGLSKSGFYRYCLAKELGADNETAIKVAEHAAVGNFGIIQVGDNNEASHNLSTLASDAPGRRRVNYKKDLAEKDKKKRKGRKK